MSGVASAAAQGRRSRLGLPAWLIVALALLAVPRVVVHDLDVGGTALTVVLALGAPAIWIAVVLARRVPRPLVTLIAVGVVYGVLLALTHQLLWTEAYDGDPPRLGGNLADLPDAAHAGITRAAAVLSSLVTGTLVGAVAGGIAELLRRARARD